MKENVSRFEFKNFKVNTHTKKTIYKLLYIILKSHGMKQNDGLFVREESSGKERSREYQNNQHTSTSCKRRGAVAVYHGRASDHFVPMGRKLHSTPSLSTQVYKWVAATYFMGVAL